MGRFHESCDGLLLLLLPSGEDAAASFFGLVHGGSYSFVVVVAITLLVSYAIYQSIATSCGFEFVG